MANLNLTSFYIFNTTPLCEIPWNLIELIFALNPPEYSSMPNVFYLNKSKSG